MALVDPYEQWKALGRPRGSLRAWQGGQAPAPVAAPVAAPLTPGVTQGNPAQISNDQYINEVRQSGQSKSEDYQRFGDAELNAWKQYYVGGGKYRNMYGDIVDKPWERGPNTPRNMNGLGVQGDYGAGWNATGVGKTGGGGGAPMPAASPTLSLTIAPGAGAPVRTDQPLAPFSPTTLSPTLAPTAGTPVRADQPLLSALPPPSSALQSLITGLPQGREQGGYTGQLPPNLGIGAQPGMSPLARTLTPWQGQPFPTSPLTPMLSPYQRRKPGSWF